MCGRPEKALAGRPRRIQARWRYPLRPSPPYHCVLRSSVTFFPFPGLLARLSAHDIIGPVSATTMRAFVVTGPGEAGVQEVDAPVARPGEVVIDVERAGVCGTDVEFFTGEMAYLHDGHAKFPIRLGHEWAGTVSAAGEGVDLAWIGRRVTGDTMLGCGTCGRCRGGYQHVCESRQELGIRGGRPGRSPSSSPCPPRRCTPCRPRS